MKIDIESVESVLVENKIPQDKITKVLSELQEIKEEEKKEKEGEKLPRQKSEFGVILFSEDPELLKNKELTAHIYQVKQGFDHSNVLGIISSSAREHNANTKKKKNMVDTIGAAFAHIKRKYSKAANWQNKTKSPVIVTVSSNKLIE